MEANNIFSINRFGKLFLLETKTTLSNYWITIISFIAVYFVFYLIDIFFFDFTLFTPQIRIITITAFVLISLFIAPSKIYGNVNEKNKGVIYALLPVSAFEKLISMSLNIILLPVIGLSILLLAIDTLLVILPFLNDSYTTIWNSILERELFTVEQFVTLGIVFSFALYGNLLFKKHKTGKTLLSFLGINMLVAIILSHIFISSTISDDSISALLSTDIDNNTIYDILYYLYTGLSPIVLLVLSYFRIKNQRY